MTADIQKEGNGTPEPRVGQVFLSEADDLFVTDHGTEQMYRLGR